MEARSREDVEELKARFATLGERVVEAVKALKYEVQGDLERSAERIGQTVVSTVGEIRVGIEASVDRVKDKVNVVAAVRRNPATAFAIAAGAGFVLAMHGGRRRALPPAPAMQRQLRMEETLSAATRGALKGGLVMSVMTPLLLEFGRMTAIGIVESVIRRKPQTNWN